MDYQSHDGGFYIRVGVVIDIRVTGLGTRVTIPIVLAAHLTSIRGKMHVHISAPPANKMWIGFYSPPLLDVKVETEIGSKYKLVNIPKIADIIVNKLQSEMIKMMVVRISSKSRYKNLIFDSISFIKVFKIILKTKINKSK